MPSFHSPAMRSLHRLQGGTEAVHGVDWIPAVPPSWGLVAR